MVETYDAQSSSAAPVHRDVDAWRAGAPENEPEGQLLANRHRTVDRVISILEHLATQADGASLSDLVRVLDAPKSSVHGLVQGLLAAGYVSEGNGRFLLGPGIEALAAPSRLRNLTKVARRHLEALATATRETAILGTRVGNSIMYLDDVPSSEVIRYAPKLHQRRPLFSTSSIGKIFMAELSDRQLARLLASHDVPDMTALQNEFRDIREGGISINRGETIPGVFSAACGIRDLNGVLVAAISVAGPQGRMEDRLDEIAREVKMAAERISAALSHR